MAGYALLEALVIVLICPGEIKRHHAKFPHEGVLPAISHHGRQMLPQGIMLRPLGQPRHWSERLWVIRPQKFTLRGQHKFPRAIFSQKAGGGDRPQQPTATESGRLAISFFASSRVVTFSRKTGPAPSCRDHYRPILPSRYIVMVSGTSRGITALR